MIKKKMHRVSASTGRLKKIAGFKKSDPKTTKVKTIVKKNGLVTTRKLKGKAKEARAEELTGYLEEDNRSVIRRGLPP